MMAIYSIAEIWRVVEGFPSYSVSNRGRVRRTARARGTPAGILKNSRDRNGYAVVNLHQDRKQTKVYVHRLVARAFLGPQPNGMHVAHWDGDGMNADASNLRWATQSENESDKRRHGRANYASGSRTFGEAEQKAITSRRANGESINSIAKSYGVSFGAVKVVVCRTSP